MTPRRSCSRAATSEPSGDLLGASVPSRSKTKSFLMVFLLVRTDRGTGASVLHHPKRVTNPLFVDFTEVLTSGMSPEWSRERKSRRSRTVLGMRQFARPKFGASRVLHSRARVPHAGHATRRVALVVVALGVACLGLPSTGAVARQRRRRRHCRRPSSPPATPTRDNSCEHQPIPPARPERVAPLPTPTARRTGDSATRHVVRPHHLYLLPASVSVDEYVRAHLPSGEKVTGTGTGSCTKCQPRVQPRRVAHVRQSPRHLLRHLLRRRPKRRTASKNCASTSKSIYLPILHVKMPTDGVITVTGYGKTSLMDGRAIPSSVDLEPRQALRLRTAIEGLKDLGTASCAWRVRSC